MSRALVLLALVLPGEICLAGGFGRGLSDNSGDFLDPCAKTFYVDVSKRIMPNAPCNRKSILRVETWRLHNTSPDFPQVRTLARAAPY